MVKKFTAKVEKKGKKKSPVINMDSPLTKDEFIKKFKKLNGFKEIGSGTYAKVYGSKNCEFVYKIGYYTNAKKDPYLSYLRAIAGSNNPAFPVVRTISLCSFKNPKAKGKEKLNRYSHNFYVVEMEKLARFDRSKTSAPYVSLHEELDNHVNFEAYSVTGKSVLTIKEEGLVDEIPQIDEILQLLDRLGEKFKPDWHSDNLMMRQDGQLVITDPVH